MLFTTFCSNEGKLFSRIPLAFERMLGGAYDWGYRTVYVLPAITSEKATAKCIKDLKRNWKAVRSNWPEAKFWAEPGEHYPFTAKWSTLNLNVYCSSINAMIYHYCDPEGS